MTAPQPPVTPAAERPYTLAQMMPAPTTGGGPQPPLGTRPPKRRSGSVWLIAGLVIALGIGITAIAAAIGGGPSTSSVAGAPSTEAGCDGYAVDTSTGAVVCKGAESAPRAEASAAPAAAPPAAERDQTFTGRGDKVVKLTLSDRAHIAAISHSGGGNFIVTAVDASGEQLDLLANEIGKYSGVRPLDFEQTPAALKVETSGSWKIVVRTLDKAPRWPAAAGSGKGDAVVLVDQGASGDLATVKITHKGQGNFIVYAYGDREDLLVNEIGSYSGEVLLPGGTVAISIEAEGAWTMTSV
jgi:hypothetical protein